MSWQDSCVAMEDLVIYYRKMIARYPMIRILALSCIGTTQIEILAAEDEDEGMWFL